MYRCINSSGGYFPFFHTDIEWDTFKDSNGFQVWVCFLEEDKSISPRGNMFLLETDQIENANVLEIKEDSIVIKENKSKLFPRH